MTYEVKANYYGDVVYFEVQAEDEKEAYKKAKERAYEIFDYSGIADPPTVTVKRKREEGKGAKK